MITYYGDFPQVIIGLFFPLKKTKLYKRDLTLKT